MNIRHFRWKGLRGLSWCCGDYDLSALGEVGGSGGRSVACRSQVYTKPRHIVYNRRHTLDYTEKSGSVHNFPFVFLSLYHRSPKQHFKRRELTERAFPKYRMDASAGDYTQDISRIGGRAGEIGVPFLEDDLDRGEGLPINALPSLQPN